MLEEIQGIRGFSSGLLKKSGLVNHLFCSRVGGVSTGAFSSFNMSFSVGDPKSNVAQNRALLSSAFGFTSDRLFTVKQVHGSRILDVTDSIESVDGFEGDGLVTRRKDIVLGILTADCIPILMLEPEKEVIAALHGGWKGLAGGIIKEGISFLVSRYGASKDALLIVLGPYINKNCFTVGGDVLKILKNRYPAACLPDCSGDKHHVDLASLAISDIIDSGVKVENVERVGTCTSCDKDHFFSYRRDGETGRQLSFIKLC